MRATAACVPTDARRCLLLPFVLSGHLVCCHAQWAATHRCARPCGADHLERGRATLWLSELEPPPRSCHRYAATQPRLHRSAAWRPSAGGGACASTPALPRGPGDPGSLAGWPLRVSGGCASRPQARWSAQRAEVLALLPTRAGALIHAFRLGFCRSVLTCLCFVLTSSNSPQSVRRRDLLPECRPDDTHQ